MSAMVRTCLQWILSGPLEAENHLTKLEATSLQTPFYYRTTVYVRKKKSCFTYLSICSMPYFRRQLLKTATTYYLKQQPSTLSFSVGSKNLPQRTTVTVFKSETSLGRPSPRYRTSVVLFHDKRLRYVSAATLTPAQLELTYVFALGVKKSGENMTCKKKERVRTKWWVYRY